MPAKWSRVSPMIVGAEVSMKGGMLIMATLAKKHLTIFKRSRRAPGAGHPDVKAAFTSAAHGTLGEAERTRRNAAIASAVRGKGPGVIRRKSRARAGSPLYGKVYEIRTR